MKLFLSLLLFAAVFTVNGEVLYRDAYQPEAARVIQSDGSGSTIEFNLLDLEVVDADLAEFGRGSVFRISTQGDFLGIVGSPDLPVVRRMVLIPDHGDVELEIITEQTSSLGNYRVAPWQERPTWSGPVPEYRIDDDIYKNSDLFPGAAVEIENIIILRDIRVAWVRFNPVRVNTVTGEVLMTTSVTVRIKGNDLPGENELNRISTGYTRSFLPIYEQVLGFENDGKAVDGSYVFIGTTESIGLAQDLIDWKKQKGYDVQVGDLATIGSSVSEIDAWLESAFNNWPNPPEYVMLIGDSHVVPTPQYSGNETHAADNLYAVVGSGSLPSMHIGRISGNDTDDLAYISWKIMSAEMDPYQPTGDSWFNSAFSMGCTIPFCGATESLMLHQFFMANGLQSTFYCNALGGVTPTLSAIISELNDGVSVINYIGHGVITGWETSSFYINSISGLTNGRKMPWVFTIGCQNGEFDGYYCFTEAFLSEGTIADPKGAINVMGSSTFTPIGPGDTLQIHTFRGYFTEDIHHLGAAHSYGKAACITSFGSAGVDMVNMAHVFGCPEIDIYTDTLPIAGLTNTHSTSVTAGAFQVMVSDDTDAPVDGALVGVYYADTKELLDSGYTNASGVVNLTISSLPGAGTVTITSTAHNRVPAFTYANSTGTAEGGGIAALPSFYLNHIYPNPVTSTASISFSTSTAGNISLEVYDISGRKISAIQSGDIEAGTHSITWDGSGSEGRPIPNGLYFLNLSTAEGIHTQSFVILR
ncbi:MAG: T9SS type A sorting domain-containing protein [Candidatus Sabulitectum sp.]|nr:T9SS type A sorting domain-containing protein [Candidatus Sabulitectum sp.]